MAHNPRVGIDEKLVKEKSRQIAQMGESCDALEEKIIQKKAEEEGRKHCYQY